MRKIPIILDGDPGHDDAIGWMLAKALPEFEILAVCSAAGNQISDKTTYNAQRICSLLGIEAPCARGAVTPLVSPLVTAGNWHGESGLDGAEMPQPADLSDLPAVDLMASVIQKSEEPVTIVSTGPLTNAAMLLLTYPELKNRIARISIMGGGIFLGNWVPAAEFNILEDPEAADIVFRSGVPVTMCGLDVTELAQILPEDIAAIRNVGNHVADVVADWVSFFIRHPMGIGYAGAPVHDPLAVLALVHPEMFHMEEYHVEIDLSGEYTRGETVCDFRIDSYERLHITPNVQCVTGINRDRYIDLICDCLRSYGDGQDERLMSELPEKTKAGRLDQPACKKSFISLSDAFLSSPLFAAPKIEQAAVQEPENDRKIPVWIDTDAGTDDAVAILTAFALPELEIKGMSAVAGNVELTHTFRNTRDIVHFLGRENEVRVYAGAEKAMVLPPRTAKFVHGERGLGTASLPPSPAPMETEKAWDALYRCARENSGRLDLIMLGPQTNAAIALRKYPDLVNHIHRILFMGGADVGGNTTAAAEFNIYADPHAAEAVLRSGIPVVMCGLDVTRKMYLTAAEYARMEQMHTAKSAFVYEVLRNSRGLFGDEGCCMHDSCPVLYAAKPSLFTAYKAGIHVETKSPLTLGQTVTDMRSDVKFPERHGVVVTDIDREQFVDILFAALS